MGNGHMHEASYFFLHPLPYSSLLHPALGPIFFCERSVFCYVTLILLFIHTLAFSYNRNHAVYKIVCLVYWTLWSQGAQIFLQTCLTFMAQ